MLFLKALFYGIINNKRVPDKYEVKRAQKRIVFTYISPIYFIKKHFWNYIIAIVCANWTGIS